MATPTNRDATYVVKSNKDSSVQRGVVDLVEGANEIEIRVTAAAGPATPDDATDDCADASPDDNITCYTVTVTRALSTEPRTTTLSVLSFAEQNPAAPATPTVSAFMPSFAPDDAPASGGYTAYAAAAEADVVLTATASHSGASVTVRSGADEKTAMDATATAVTAPVTVNLTTSTESPAGKTDTVILVTVTASDQVTSQTYKLMVVRGAAGSDDGNLSALSVTAGGDDVVLTPAFAATTGNTAYSGSARVPNSTTSVTVTAEPEDARNGATYAVTSDKDRNVQNNQVDLAEGANVIKVTVTGADKVSTLEHMVTVTRVAGNLSTDTTLSALSLVDNNNAAVDLDDPGFIPNSEPVDGGYTAEVGSAITSVTVTATEAHTGASIEVRAGADYDAAKADDPIAETSAGSDQYLIDEAAGFQGQGADTVILVTVTASDLGNHRNPHDYGEQRRR